MFERDIPRRDFLRLTGLGVAGAATLRSLPGLRLSSSLLEASMSPSNLTGKLDVWDWSDAPSVFGEEEQSKFYGVYIPSLFKKLDFAYTIYGYTDMLPKLTVAWRSGTTPDVARVAIAWGPQFIGAGQAEQITAEEIGLPLNQFWPQALQSVRKDGATSGPIYGVPSNNEAMFLIYNKGIFRQAGLDPSHGPRTWAELVSYSKTIHDKTGKYGYGLVAVQNNGNTPFRFMPMAWAYGGSIFDELSPHPTWRKIGINSEGVIEALSLYNQMYNVDKSVQPSALSDEESDVATLFTDEKVAMIIDHPSAAQQIRQLKPQLDMGGDLIPAGPVRRAVVFGGSNLIVRAGTPNKEAALAFIRAYIAPEWNVLLGTGAGSEASTVQARASSWQAKISAMEPFNDLVFKMLPYGVNVPLVTQGAQIWNITVPNMIQEVLTKRLTPQAAAAQAAAQIRQIMS